MSEAPDRLAKFAATIKDSHAFTAALIAGYDYETSVLEAMNQLAADIELVNGHVNNVSNHEIIISTFAYIMATSVTHANKWHDGDFNSWTVLEWAGAMCGEAGEAANVTKKIRRAEQELVGNKAGDWQVLNTEALDKKLAQECADTFLYLILLAARRRIDLGRAIIDTFNRKSEEVGFPERL